MDGAPEVVRLEIRSRQAISEGGRQRTELTVYCPFRQRSVDLEQCEECSAFIGTDGSPQETWNRVACHRREAAAEVPEAPEFLARAALQRTPLSRLMSRHAICVRPDLPLRELPGIFAAHRIGGVPVVDEQFRPMGMLTRTDLLRQGFELAMDRGEEVLVPRPARFAGTDGCAADSMSQPAVALGERDSVLDAARLMSTQRVHRAVVTSRDGRVVGIVSSCDVLRWLSRETPKDEGVAAVPGTD